MIYFVFSSVDGYSHEHGKLPHAIIYKCIFLMGGKGIQLFKKSQNSAVSLVFKDSRVPKENTDFEYQRCHIVDVAKVDF